MGHHPGGVAAGARGAWRTGVATFALLLLLGTRAWSGDLTLRECVELAIARSPEARAVALATVAAEAHVRSAHAAYSPQLFAKGEYGVSGGFDVAVTNGGSTATLLSFEATLLDGGLRNAQLSAAQAHLREARALEREQLASVAFATRVAYFSALASDAQAEIQGETVETLRRYVGLLGNLEARAIVPLEDVLRARLALQAAESEGRGAQSDAAIARNTLDVLTGLAVDGASLAEPGDVRLAPPADEEIDQAPSIADARATAEAAESEARAVRSEARGQLKVTADAGALGVRPERTFRENGGGQFLLSYALPLFDGGALDARLAAAEAAARGATAKLDAAKQSLALDLARARKTAEKADADVRAARGSIPIAADHFELIRARYLGGGNVRLLEVLDSLAQHVDARLRASRALLELRSATATEQQLLGDATP